MSSDRRDFLKGAATLAGLSLMDPLNAPLNAAGLRNGVLTFRFRPYTLEMKHVFAVAEMSRTTTPVMLTEVEYNGVIGYGEASMPPYLGESHATAQAFLAKVDLAKYDDPFRMEQIFADIDAVVLNDPATNEIYALSLHDLVGKL